MRTDLPQLIALAQRLLDHGEPGTLATLFCAHGSSYRSLGSMMVGGPPGVVAGGVSGGCLEEYIVRHGREMTSDRGAVLLSFDTGSADDIDSAKPVLGCGGSIEVLVERLTRDGLEHLRRLDAAYASDVASLTLCSAVPTDNSADASVAVTRRWGRPDEDDPMVDVARQALCDRRSYCRRVGRDGRALVHYVPPMTRLVIFGAGQDVRPLCDLARSLGWHVTVADRRTRLARADHFPSADAIVASPWKQAVGQIRFTANTAIVLMTHSLPDDAVLLPLLADKPFAYAGVLGPAHRREALLTLASEAVATTEAGAMSEAVVMSEARAMNDDFLARLRGPIGLDLGDRSPAGIAVSIISEILAQLNDRDARAMSRPASPAHTLSLSTAHA